MEENVIFKNPQNKPPVSSMPSQVPSDKSIAKKILKLILGILVVGILGAFAAVFFIPKQEDEPTSAEATLVYWGLWEDPNVMQPIISDFTKQNPNIKVSLAKQEIEQYKERILARAENETGPDVFWFHNTWWDMLSGVLAPLPSDVITKSDFEKLYYKVMHKDLIKNGAIYGIPLEIDTLSLYINTDLFNAAGLSVPTNWIDFANISRELTVKDIDGNIKTAGAAVGTFDNVSHAGDLISLFFVQNGSNLYDLSESKKASDALRFYTSFALDDKVWDDTLDKSVVAFAKGDVGMYFGYFQDYFIIKAANPDINFEVHPVPHLPDRDITIASYWAQGVSVKSKYQKEALLFLNFLAQKETQQRLFAEVSKSRGFGEPYARTDMADLLKDNPNVYPFVSQAENAVSSFFASDTADKGLNDRTNDYLRSAVNAVLSGASEDTAIDTLSQEVQKVLQEYSAVQASP